MGMKKVWAVLLLVALLSGCVEPGASPSQAPEVGALLVAAVFQTESGGALRGVVQLATGEDSGSYPLDDAGTIRASGLPRSGELLLTLFDQRQEARGVMTLRLEQGAVIDATTGEDGVGHITLKRDTEEMALRFVLTEEGALRCTLWLSEAAGKEEVPCGS